MKQGGHLESRVRIVVLTALTVMIASPFLGMFAAALLYAYGLFEAARVTFVAGWLAALGSAAVPIATLAVVLWSRSRRPPAPRCPECGYDLRGNPVVRCPECGWGRRTRR